MSDEKPIYGKYDIIPKYDYGTSPLALTEEDVERLHFHMTAFEVQLLAIRKVVREELTASKQHQHKTGMRRFTVQWGNSHVEGVQFSPQSHHGLVAVCNGGFYDFYGTLATMCAKLNILESDIVWIDEATV